MEQPTDAVDTDEVRRVGSGTDGDGIPLLTRSERALLAAAADELDRLRAATIPDGLRAASEAATPGPWTEGGSHREVYTNSDEVSDDHCEHYVITDDGGIDHPEDQAFIVAAANFVRSLLAAAPPTAEPGGQAEIVGFGGPVEGRGFAVSERCGGVVSPCTHGLTRDDGKAERCLECDFVWPSAPTCPTCGAFPGEVPGEDVTLVTAISGPPYPPCKNLFHDPRFGPTAAPPTAEPGGQAELMCPECGHHVGDHYKDADGCVEQMCFCRRFFAPVPGGECDQFGGAECPPDGCFHGCAAQPEVDLDGRPIATARPAEAPGTADRTENP